MAKRRPAYWFQYITHVCPICGKERTGHYKIDGSIPKPTDYYKIHIRVDVYDYCQEALNG